MNSFTKKAIRVKDNTNRKYTINCYRDNNTYGLSRPYSKVPESTIDEHFKFSMSVVQDSIMDTYWNGGIFQYQTSIDLNLRKFGLPEINMNLLDPDNHKKIIDYTSSHANQVRLLKQKAMAYLRRIRQDTPAVKDYRGVNIQLIDNFDNRIVMTVAFTVDDSASVQQAIITLNFMTVSFDVPISIHISQLVNMNSDEFACVPNILTLIICENTDTVKYMLPKYMSFLKFDAYETGYGLPISQYEFIITFLGIAMLRYYDRQRATGLTFAERNIPMIKELIDKERFLKSAVFDTYSHCVHMENVNCERDDTWILPYRFPCATVKEAKRIYPQFEFSESEDKFVSKYCLELIENNNYILNFKKYLSIFRFGKSVWFRCRTVSEKFLFGEIQILTNDPYGEIAIHITEAITDSCICTINTVLNHIDSFTPSSLVAYDKQIHYLNKDNIMLSSQYIEMASDLLNLTTDDIYSLIVWMMYLQIVCVERPQRTRMIREVKYLNGDPTDTREENVYLISRILRPVKEAKEYMNERGSTPEQRKRGPYIYTVAEWERVGHWRTTKSGKKVWIEPQICHRKAGITKEYVKVKL